MLPSKSFPPRAARKVFLSHILLQTKQKKLKKYTNFLTLFYSFLSIQMSPKINFICLSLCTHISLCMSKQNSLKMKKPYNASPLSRMVILFRLLDWFSSGRGRLYQSTGSNFEGMTYILRWGPFNPENY